MSEQHSSNPPMIRSDFADDPDMVELVEDFVGSMPDRIATLRAAFESGHVEEVRRIAHQLKGASGGYGFGTVGDAAGELEAAVSEQESVELKQVEIRLQELVSMCSRIAVR
jgi:HPt (histidine-containing phosphotransfer) domain-containing protein